MPDRLDCDDCKKPLGFTVMHNVIIRTFAIVLLNIAPLCTLCYCIVPFVIESVPITRAM